MLLLYTGISSIQSFFTLVELFCLIGGIHMAINLKNSFNRVLDENIVINNISECKASIKQKKKGHVFHLLILLILGSISTLFLSFISSVVGYGDTSRYLLSTMVTNFISVFINNLIFIAFLKRIRNEKYDGSEIPYFASKLLTQVLCALLLSIAQSFVMVCLLQITTYIPTLNVITSILISVFFTLLNAMVAYRIYDRKTKIKEIIPGAFSLIARNWKVLFFIALLFITWSFVSNVAFTNLLYSHIQTPQGINNIFHALLSQHDFHNIVKVGGFYAINYIVGGFLEIDILIGLALLYQRDRKTCFRDK